MRATHHARPRRVALILVAGACLGCGSLKPRNFHELANPAPVVRAGAVGLGDEQPDSVAIPAWIGRLEDKDPVVRMAASESLKKRSGRDFGFVPWAEPEERAPAVAKWKAWWDSKGTTAPASARDGLASKRRKR